MKEERTILETIVFAYLVGECNWSPISARKKVESMTYEEAMNMPSEEEPDLDDNLANGLLDEDGPAVIAGEDIWAGDDDEDIESDDNYDDFMFD